MADVEEPVFTTLAERIAALNKHKDFASPTPTSVSSASSTAASGRPASVAVQTPARRQPPAPLRPTPTVRLASTTDGAADPSLPPTAARGPPPRLPPRRPSTTQYLPPPAPSNAGRRLSSDSARSAASTATASLALSRVSSATSHGSAGSHSVRPLPPALGTVKLPPLPPTRREREAAEQAARDRAEAEREDAARIARKAAAEREAVAVTTRVSAAPPLPARTQPAQPAQPGRPALPRRRPTGPVDEPPRPALPARRPTVRSEEQEPPRPALPARRPTIQPEEPPSLPARHRPSQAAESAPSLPARHPTVRSALAMGFGDAKPTQPQRPASSVQAARSSYSNGRNDNDDNDDDAPPPLPMASRPSAAQIDAAVHGGRHARPARTDECLLCRDFSGPDSVATRYPVAQLPRQDTVNYLARELCGPFPSPTDKARAIFTWCHHNIAYDVDGFFGGCIPRGQSIEERIFSGKAVCEGYAAVYEAIARAAGLDVRTVTGHGKGFGFTTVRPGDRVPPPNPTGHAWNAVRIDGGVWKLLDACWGAGNVSNQRAERYEKRFMPSMFTMSNEVFGERHFPSDPSCFFRADGRALSWAEYVVEPSADPEATLYTFASETQYIDARSVEPAYQPICVSGRADPRELVYFRFARPCPHWKTEVQGHGLEPYLMLLKTKPDGGAEEMVEMRYESPLCWSADVPRGRLGEPDTLLSCFAFTTCNGQDMRGASMADYRASRGRCQMGFSGVCAWKLA